MKRNEFSPLLFFFPDFLHFNYGRNNEFCDSKSGVHMVTRVSLAFTVEFRSVKDPGGKQNTDEDVRPTRARPVPHMLTFNFIVQNLKPSS